MLLSHLYHISITGWGERVERARVSKGIEWVASRTSKWSLISKTQFLRKINYLSCFYHVSITGCSITGGHLTSSSIQPSRSNRDKSNWKWTIHIMARTYSRISGEVSTTPFTGNGQRTYMSQQRKGIRSTTKQTEDIFAQVKSEWKKKNSQRAAEWLNSKAAAEDMAPK